MDTGLDLKRDHLPLENAHIRKKNSSVVWINNASSPSAVAVTLQGLGYLKRPSLQN